MNKLIKNLGNEILSAVFPYKCLSCGDIIEDKGFCKACIKELKEINFEKRCKKCGREKEYCICGYRVFRFESLVSLYENSGTAKIAYYNYKLGGRVNHAVFFAEQLAKAAEHEYCGIDFKFLTFVPSSKFSKFKHGFDHNMEIASRLSKFMRIPLKEILVCKPFRRSQHRSNAESRLKNVKNKYYVKDKISGGNVLLFDDIVTTGATLDECAKQLLIAGADKVYCISFLQSANHNLKGSEPVLKKGD